MAMFNIIVDTSVIIDHLRGRSNQLVQLKDQSNIGKVRLFIPHIVITELYIGKEARNKAGREIIDGILKDLETVGFTVSSAKLSGELIRTYQQIPDPFDLIIAAIAIENEAQVATNNKKHFEQIRGLKLYNFKAPISSKN